MAKMKVFGGLMFMGAKGQCRTVIAATSQAKAADAVGETIGQFRAYWSETRNKKEVEIALSDPGQLFQARSSDRSDFEPLEIKNRVRA